MRFLVGAAMLAGCHGKSTPRPIASHVAGALRLDAMADVGVHVPPRQHDVWTGGAALPPELASAVATVFEQGLADPRGLEYREVELVVATLDGNAGQRAKTHAWVFEGDRYAVAWNGLTYPVAHLGAIVDARSDAARLRDATKPDEPVWAEGDAVLLERVSLLKIALLARIGEDAIASSLWKTYAPERQPDAYLAIASAWTYALYDRAATARIRGDRALALVSARATAVAARSRARPRAASWSPPSTTCACCRA